MDRKLLNKVMKKLASSNVVKKTSEESTSSSLSTHKDSETEQIQQKMEQYLLNRYHFRFNVLTEQTEYSKKGNGIPIYPKIRNYHPIHD